MNCFAGAAVMIYAVMIYQIILSGQLGEAQTTMQRQVA